MPKKSNTRAAQGSGTIRQRKDGKWEARYTVGRDPGTGRQIQKSVYADTQKEVRIKLQKAVSEVDAGTYVDPEKKLVGEWLDEWFAVYVLPALRQSTATGYQDEIRLHLKPKFGAVRLQALRPEMVQAGFNALAKDGYAPATLKKARTVLHAALKRAVRNKLLASNPCADVCLPSMADRDEIRYLTMEQQKSFVDQMPDTATGRALLFILGTGLRAEEITGLRWRDVEKDRFTIRQTIRRNRNFEAGNKTVLVTAAPKTRNGAREIPLSAKMQNLIAAQRQYARESAMRTGAGWNDEMPVFATTNGTPVEGRNLTRALHGYMDKIGLEHIGLHGLRHTFATRWVENGGDIKTLSEILGHASVKITLELYVHSTAESKKKAMQEMDIFL